MDIECQSAGKNVRREEMDKDVKGRLEDCVERSETTEKNSKATDESYPMRKENNHKGIIRTTSKM